MATFIQLNAINWISNVTNNYNYYFIIIFIFLMVFIWTFYSRILVSVIIDCFCSWNHGTKIIIKYCSTKPDDAERWLVLLTKGRGLHLELSFLIFHSSVWVPFPLLCVLSVSANKFVIGLDFCYRYWFCALT